MHKFLKINGLFFCFCWIQLLSLYAQDDPCIRFEDLPADAVYGRDANQSPGDLAFSLKGVDAYLEEFIYSNTNETGFWNVSVNEDIFGQQQAVDGQSLFISNINLRFDFKNLEQPVNGLCFRIVDGGGEENIAVNGQPILVIPDFSDVPEEIAPGVFMSVNPLPDPNGNSIFNAEICLRGPIEELLIGGQEFAFDNLCFFHEPCTLSDLKAEVVNCDFVNEDVYVYEVAVDFSLPSTSNVPVSFDLFINNTFRGYFNTADLPLRMEQIRVLADQEVFDVTVCVNDRPDCCISLDLPNAGCPEDCNIEQVEIGEIECSFDGYYRTKIFTKGTNLSGSLKITNEAGETWFGPADGSELVKFPIPDQNYDKWIVCDPQYPNCCFTLDFDVPCPTCRIGPLQAEASECTDDGMFFIKLDFDHFTPTGQFYVFINEEEYSAHPYSSLPLRLGPFPADGITGYKVLVRDASEQCDQDIYLEPVTCPPYNCEIGALKVSERECTASGEFYFKLDFDHARTSEKFQLLLNQDVYESYAYADLPVKVGPLPADGITDWHLLVKDLEGPCASEGKLEAVDCEPADCEIGPLHLSGPVCNDNGAFFFKLDFEHKNNADVFKLYLNGELYEQYPYQELPVTVGPLPADGTTDWHILVEDLSGLCAEDTKLKAVNCNPKTCEIGELKLSEAICTEDGQFYFEMNFDHANTTDKFILYLNGEKYESYAYGSLPIKVGPLPTGISNDWHVLVRDAGSDNIEYCASDAHLKVECPGGDCKIGELKLIETYCTDDGQAFYTHLNFQHEGTSEKFDLYLNDEHYGSFAYGELPLKLGPFNALIDLEWKLLVKDASGNCAEDIHFSAPNCGGGDECNLSNLVVERYPCIGGQFLVDLAFDIKDPGAEGYYVFTNGQINGPYSYDQAFITLGPFVGDGSTVYDFLVIDIADPSCYGYYELGPVDCSNPCTISDVFAEANACNDDGGFMVDVSFNYDKVGGSGFSILANGETFGPFEYGEKYYTFGPLDGDGLTAYEIVVVDNDHPDCRDFTTLDAIDCLPCNIGTLEYTVECLQNSKQFILNLDFEYENPDSEQFTLALGDQVVGSFFYADLPLSQELELPASGELIVAVWDSENESCAQKAEFSIPCCYLSELIVEAYPCENDGELWIELDLDHYNVSNSFQLVYGPTGGELQVKEYTYSDLPITLGPLPGQASTEWYFEVTDLGFFCQSSTEISVDYCDNDACAEWEETTPGAYGPLTGYEPGDLIDEEDGLRLAFAPDNADNCNCSVFITKASTFPAFQAGNGQVVMLDNSGALIGAPGYEIQSLVVDYYFTGNEALLRVNGEPIIAAAHPLDLPENIAPGVKLQVEPTSNDGRNGRMIFSGTIYRLSLLSRGKWVLDNFCTEKTEKEDEVWPGDTNLDNIANHIDLLNIGLAYGEEGPARANANISWEAQQAEDWPGFFFDKDLNYKHADANGDGRIDRTDRAPIMEHYGLTHGPLPVFNDVPATDNDPPLYVDFTASPNPIPAGGTFQVPIIFGTENQPVNDIYGIAFTITFDPAVIDPTSIEVVYPDSWLGDTETDLLTLDRTLQDLGRIDVALTRIDKINVGGFGTIASLIGAIDDIAGKETTVGITEVVAITAAEDRVPVNGKEVIVEFSDELKPETGYIDLNASLNIFPNPTSSEVLITTRFNYPIERIRVLDGYGNPTGLHVEGKNRINLQELPSGVYMLRIQLGDYTISRKVIKVN